MAPTEKDMKKQNKLLREAAKIVDAATDKQAAIKGLRPELKEALRDQYGYAFSLIRSDAGLTDTFATAVKEGWTEEKFTQELQRTKWWKSRENSQRLYDTWASDPTKKTDLQRKISDASIAIKEQAKAIAGVDVSDEQAKSLAKDLLRDRWDSWTEFVPRIVGDIFVNEGNLDFGGTAATTLQDIRKHAKDMGVFLDDSTLSNYVDRIYSNKDTLENVIGGITKQAEAYYPQFADSIKAGATVRSIAEKYTYAASELLEKDPTEFDFFGNNPVKSDPLMAKAMFGGKDGQAMSLYDFRKAVKQDARWKKTRNARDEYATMTNNLLRSFGI
jgi:uncharacterized protein YfcZ (UPF0381/DUF406 family)